MEKRAFAFLCLVGVSVAAGSAPAQSIVEGPVDYALGPESQPQAGVPKGTLTQHTLAPGKYYPGTPHNYQVYVPAQYNASRPTPFMIFLDGNGYAGDGSSHSRGVRQSDRQEPAAGDDRHLHQSRRVCRR